MYRWKNILLLISLGLLLTASLSKADEEENDDSEDEEEESAPSEPERENGVYVLTDDNFDSFIEDKEVVLLEFYAPWCGHCKTFAPTYEKIAQALEGKVAVAKIDATASKDLGGRYEVTGYPTVKILKKVDGEHQAITYDGARTEDAVVQKVMELSDPDWKPPPEAVLTLTTENFDETVNNADIILVEFYAPWCGHCKKLAPEYEAAAQELKNRDTPLPLAKVDATAESALGTRFDVSGYPTLKLFRRGRAYEYDGGRDKTGIVNYMLEQSKPPSTSVETVKAIRNILHHSSDVTIIGCFNGADDTNLEVYQDSGNSLRSEYTFHHTFNKDVMDDVGCSEGEIVLFHPERFHSKYEKKSYKFPFSKSTTKAELEKYFSSHSVPLVGQRTRDNKDKRYGKRPLVVVYYGVDFSFDYRVATQVWRNKVLEVANQFKKVTFAIANEEDFQEELKRVGLEDSPEEINVIAYDDEDRKYPMEPNEEFDAEVLQEFVEDFLAGKLKPKIKSAPKPKKNSGAVKVVVGDTFNELVMGKKNVLIEFYAPWCGHCKKLEPVFKKLGKKLKGNDKVVIAKMDATANDIPHSAYKAEGFPTLYWAPEGSKDKPVKYDGGRELDDLLKFVNEKLSSSKDEL
nr:protein disulfide-isomerase A4-like isoform X1 [Ciona intestinalis]|eukprot:XP_002130820.1 protein disulfide-isomerase A4-like isoform X1 [Ciona intestinalis]